MATPRKQAVTGVFPEDVAKRIDSLSKHMDLMHGIKTMSQTLGVFIPPDADSEMESFDCTYPSACAQCACILGRHPSFYITRHKAFKHLKDIERYLLEYGITQQDHTTFPVAVELWGLLYFYVFQYDPEVPIQINTSVLHYAHMSYKDRLAPPTMTFIENIDALTMSDIAFYVTGTHVLEHVSREASEEDMKEDAIISELHRAKGDWNKWSGTEKEPPKRIINGRRVSSYFTKYIPINVDTDVFLQTREADHVMTQDGLTRMGGLLCQRIYEQHVKYCLGYTIVDEGIGLEVVSGLVQLAVVMCREERQSIRKKYDSYFELLSLRNVKYGDTMACSRDLLRSEAIGRFMVSDTNIVIQDIFDRHDFSCVISDFPAETNEWFLTMFCLCVCMAESYNSEFTNPHLLIDGELLTAARKGAIHWDTATKQFGLVVSLNEMTRFRSNEELITVYVRDNIPELYEATLNRANLRADNSFAALFSLLKSEHLEIVPERYGGIRN